MTDNLALREELAYQIRSWRPAKTFSQSLADADTVIAAIEIPVAAMLPIMHEPLVKFVADAFVVDWAVANAALTSIVQIVVPDLTMNVGENNSGARRGYRRGSYGHIEPDRLLDGNPIEELRLRVSNGNFIFRVSGFYTQDAFTSLTVVGDNILLAALVDNFDNSGTYTEWKWNNSGINLEVGETYAIEFT